MFLWYCSFTTVQEMLLWWAIVFLGVSSTEESSFTDIEYPCQPFDANKTFWCDELFSLPRHDDGSVQFCNRSSVSCNPNKTKYNRRDALRDGCYCDSLCKTLGDCCVDFDLWITPNKSKQSVSSVVLECRMAPSSINKGMYGYVMVTSCPLTWSDAQTERSCMSTNYSADPASALPVVDMVTSLTYANIYCAMCHGKSDNLRLWDVQIWMKRGVSEISLQAIRSLGTFWEVRPFDIQAAQKCVITPNAARTGHDTKLKHLCRSYANGVDIEPFGSFKNPHCALLWNGTILNKKVRCSRGTRVAPRLPSMLFAFTKTRKQTRQVPRGVLTLHVDYTCESNEVYDPFQSRCIPVILASSSISPSVVNQHKCTAEIRFLPSEFHILSNYSVLVFAHHKTYSNESFVLENNTLILCTNLSRNYTELRNTLEEVKTKQKFPPIQVITYVGFSVSIVFLLFLLVTFLLFVELRTFPGKKVMHLSCAMIAMQSMYLVSDPDVVSSGVCAVIGVLLHYFILVVFSWMSTIAYNTQKAFSSANVNIQIFNSPLTHEQRRRTYTRNCLCCWGLPFVTVGICVVLQVTNIGNTSYGYDDGCQLNLPARTFAVTIPVSLMLVFNIGALIQTVVAMRKSAQAASTQRNLPVIVLKLTSVLGVTWILGFVLAFYHSPYLEYPYVVVNSLQGVLICFSFVFTKRVYILYKQRFLCSTAAIPNGNENNHG